MTDTYGQSDALAVAVADALNNINGSLCLSIDAERLFARKLDIPDIADINESVTVQVFPGDEMADLDGMGRVYNDTYGCHVLLLQRVADPVNGGLSESQVALLLRLRSEIVEYLCSTPASLPSAVHPVGAAVVTACRHGKEGIYDLSRLEENNVFYSDLIVTYKAVGLRRRT